MAYLRDHSCIFCIILCTMLTIIIGSIVYSYGCDMNIHCNANYKIVDFNVSYYTIYPIKSTDSYYLKKY